MPVNVSSMIYNPDTLESYARIFEMRRRYFDNDLQQWFWLDPSEVELAAASALRFMAAHSSSKDTKS